MTASASKITIAPGKWQTLILRAFLVLALLASPSALGVESANAALALVQGTVRNADTGEPVSGAVVHINDTAAPEVKTTTTDAQGKFSFSVDAGQYWIEVEHPDFYYFQSTYFVVSGGVLNLSYSLEPIPPFIPIEGSDRFETAVAASKEAHPIGLDPLGYRTVVIATGRNWPDALGGAALAGVLEGPVLLVDTNVLPAVVSAEIDRLDAKEVRILGGDKAVGPAVEAALKAKLGAGNVERIGGGDRYVTANKVAAEVREVLGIEYAGVAFVATGGNFPDALAAAPLAAGNGWPIYLAHPKTGLSASTVTAMTGVGEAVILGGDKAVSAATEAGLKTRLGPTNVERLWGDSRYTTAVDIAEYAVAEFPWFQWDGVGLTTSTDFPDALAGGVLQGYHGRVMLLTPSNSLHPAAAAVLSAKEPIIDTVVFFGGTKALSQVVRDQALQLVGN